jgi:hypothetical protein
MTAVELEPLTGEAAVTAGALTFALFGTVETTVDPAQPVASELRLSIGAPPAAPGDAGAVTTGVFYLTFRWGSDAGALCTELEAAAIVVTPDSDAEHWGVMRGSAPDVGPYWILTPPRDGGPAPGESCGFLIGNIVTASPADLPPTLCFASCWHATGGTIDETATPSFWRAVPLAISALESSPSAPTPGTPARLIWKTTGASGCRLEPGDEGALPPSGELPFALDGPREFSLTATGSASGASVTRRLRVAPPQGWTQLTRGAVVSEDAPVLLALDNEVLCLQPQSGYVRASRDGRSWTRRALALPDRVSGAAGCVWAGGIAVTGGLPESTFDGSASIVATSRDGQAWTAATTSAFTQRSGHGAVSFAWRLWAIGGVGPLGVLSDVLSSPDGVSWSALGAPPWGARARPGLAVHGDALWLSGGLSTGTAAANAFTDVWQLGRALTWEQAAVPPWNGARVATFLAVAGGRLHALLVPLGEGRAVQLWVLDPEPVWTLVSAAAPVTTRRLLAARIAMTAFGGGLLVTSDAGAWWYGPVST